MKTKFHRLTRGLYIALAMAVGAIGLLPALEQTVFADQVTTRSIQMSSSVVSATGASYLVTFTTGSANTALSLIVDFCQNSPIISDTCTTTNGVTFTSAAIASTNLPAGWAFDSTSGSTIKIKGTSTALSATTSYHFTITGVNNPTGTASTGGAAGSFYARMYTFSTNAYGTYTSPTSLGTTVDYGGVALSTVTQISISATVQETLTFCVSGSTISGTCSGLTSPTLTIGTGSPAVLDTSGESAPAYTQLTTNANGGVSVRMKAVNACTNGGLSTAPPDVSGGCANIAGRGTVGTLSGGQWGLCVAPGAGVSATTNYIDSGGSSCPTTYYAAGTYGMVGANVTSTYGDAIYTTSGAVNAISSTLNFAAKAASTTPAGVYQANEILIATGTF